VNRFLQVIKGIFQPYRERTVAKATTAATASHASPVIEFQLRGCRELLNFHADSLPIRSAIEVIERSIPNDPGLAFTHCRGLLETVCKTILADRGVAAPADAAPNWLMSQTLKVLKLTPDTFDGDNRVEEGVENVLRGLNQLINGVVALRNSQGVGPHGKDALEAVLDADYAIITAQAIDSAVALLYRLHRKQSESDPLSRIRFGDYPDFDAYLDDKYPDLEIEEVPIQASKALYLQELKAYRDRLTVFLAEGSDVRPDEEFGEGEALGEHANG
jgi:abortive infection Abi-like protein